MLNNSIEIILNGEELILLPQKAIYIKSESSLLLSDIHLGKMGPECGDCHTQTAWLPTTFKHNTTGFRLSGAHRYVECSSCHVNQIYQGLPADCYFCHSDSHLAGIGQHSVGSIQECADCHTSLSWKIRRGGGIQ